MLKISHKVSFHVVLAIISLISGLLPMKMYMLKQNNLYMREESKGNAVRCGESGHFVSARLFPL